MGKMKTNVETFPTRMVLREVEETALCSNHYFSVISAQHNIDFSKIVPNDALDILNLNGLENKIKEPTRFGNISNSCFLVHCIER